MLNLQSLLPWRGYRLDPARALAARRDFDERRGYRDYWDLCRGKLARAVPAGDDDLSRSGVEKLRLFAEEEATAILRDVVARARGVVANDKGIDYSEVLAFDDSGFLAGIFERTLRPEIDAKLVRYFGSEYFIYSYSVTRALPEKESRRSFLWHCDRGPRAFLKILLYLNATEEHGGTTEFLDRDSTAEFERIGYVFGPNRRRQADLAPLARRFGIAYAPIRWSVRAGEALIFEPSNVLHRGVLPSRGARYVLSLMLAASPVPWREAFRRTGPTGFCERNEGVWLESAGELLAITGAVPTAPAGA